MHHAQPLDFESFQFAAISNLSLEAPPSGLDSPSGLDYLTHPQVLLDLR
jgi:hypothetical protein